LRFPIQNHHVRKGKQNQRLSTLIHSCPFPNRQPALAQYWIGRVAQYSIGADTPLGAGHRFAPCRVKATGVMQSCLRWSRSHSRRRFPVACAPYAPPTARPCGCRGTVALVRRCALCGWSVACGQSCRVCPPPTLVLRRCAAQPCALVCPSAPRGGSLSPRTLAFGFCYKFRSCLRTEYGGYRPNGL
jgi:hypothetical protein